MFKQRSISIIATAIFIIMVTPQDFQSSPSTKPSLSPLYKELLSKLKDQPAETQECLSGCLQECSTKGKNLTLGVGCAHLCQESCVKQEKTVLRTPSELTDKPENYCLNGNPPQAMTHKDMLVEFANGPCSPLMLVPGIMASKLVVEIDCETFRTEEPEAFNACGWDSCVGGFFSNSPQPEYVLWIPSMFSPVAFFSFNEQANNCFSELISVNLDINASYDDMFIPKKGVSVKTFGTTPLSKDGTCGASAITGQLPDFMETDEDLKGFENMIKGLEHVGYVSGLTYQPLPYNWYLSQRKNEVSESFFSHLQRLKLLTGKKTTIIAHSSGNNNVLYNLNRLSNYQRDNYVFNYLAISPTFLGTNEAAKQIIGGTDQFMLSETVGFRLPASKKTLTNQASSFELFPKNPFTLYENQNFMGFVYQRMRYEQTVGGLNISSGIPFWPKKDENCYDNDLYHFPSSCSIGLYNTSSNDIISFEGGDSYKLSEFDRLVAEKPLTPEMPINFHRLTNDLTTQMSPGVPTVVLFANTVRTNISFEFSNSFDNRVNNGEYPTFKSKTYGNGDGVVPTYSQIVQPMKWAFENLTGSGPAVKFVEYCSKVRRDVPVYDVKDSNSSYEIHSTNYKGLECECNGTKNYDGCHHNRIHGDKFVVSFVIDLADGNQQVSNGDMNAINELSEDYLNTLKTQCPQLDVPVF